MDKSTGRLRDGEPEIWDLIKRLQAGHQWLLEQHRLWQTDDSTAASDSEFSRVWNGWWELDDQLRDEHGFQDCPRRDFARSMCTAQPGNVPTGSLVGDVLTCRRRRSLHNWS